MASVFSVPTAPKPKPCYKEPLPGGSIKVEGVGRAACSECQEIQGQDRWGGMRGGKAWNTTQKLSKEAYTACKKFFLCYFVLIADNYLSGVFIKLRTIIF